MHHTGHWSGKNTILISIRSTPASLRVITSKQLKTAHTTHATKNKHVQQLSYDKVCPCPNKSICWVSPPNPIVRMVLFRFLSLWHLRHTSVIQRLFSGLLFNCLTGHLITSYRETQPSSIQRLIFACSFVCPSVCPAWLRHH